MSRETFQYLCDQLRPLIQKQNTRMRRSVSTERRVAITLWVLATPAEYRSVAHLFGLARCTVCQIVNETCRAIVQKLLRVYVRFPTGDGLKDVVRGFKEKLAVPQCAGSIDGSHIPVTPPAMNHTDYYNRKGWYSVIVQAVVDHNYLFRDLCIGWPGSVHDARVLANSSLFKKVSSGEFLQGDELYVQGHSVRPFLIGDSAYSLLPWLIKPFSFSPLNSQQKKIQLYVITSKSCSGNSETVLTTLATRSMTFSLGLFRFFPLMPVLFRRSVNANASPDRTSKAGSLGVTASTTCM